MKFVSALFLIALTLMPFTAKAGQTITYMDGKTPLEGYLARGPAVDSPVILIVHQWMGLTDYEKMRADMLSKLGYTAFAVDIYGKGVRPKNQEEAGKLAGQYKADPAAGVRRINAALDTLKAMNSIQVKQVAVMGYCFGGTMALEYARSGADVAGIVSFHGGLPTPDPVTRPGVIKAPIQVHHGADDPTMTAAQVEAFKQEMKNADAKMEFISYPGAVHAFTQKNAGNDPSKGMAYNADADKKSWAAMQVFLKKIFKA